jgi:hypothetical protein
MKKMHLLTVGYVDYAFDTLSAAATVLAALSKAVEVDRCPDRRGVYIPSKEDRKATLLLEANQQVDLMPKVKKPLGLPAPKRNTVECPACENVSVVRGTTCQSCGTLVR